MNRFLKNRSVNLKFVKDSDVASDGPTIVSDPAEMVELVEAYAEIAKDFITHAALTIGGVYAACKIIGRICK